MALLFYSVTSLANPTNGIFENISTSTVTAPTGLQSYQGGIRVQNQYKGNLYSSTHFDVAFYQGLSHNYGSIDFERTLESALYSKVMWKDSFKNEWFAGYNFSKAIQDIERANYTDQLNNYKQTNYTLYYGWKRELSKGLSFSLYSGFTTCFYNEANQKTMLPMGGLALAYAFNGGNLRFETFQKVEGSGETSGIYGSQTRKEASLSASLDVTKKFSIYSDCLISRAEANFSDEVLPEKSPILTASVGAEYRVNKNLSARVNFSHRSYMGSSLDNQLPEGPSGSFAINYLAF